MVPDRIGAGHGRYIWGDPNSGLAGFASGGDAEIAGCADHDFFEHTHVPHYIASNSGEVEDRVADNLARSVVGDVATAAGFVEGDALLAQHVFTGEQMLALTVAALGNHVRMLANQ